MRIKTILTILVVLLLVAVVGVVVILKSMDFNEYRDLIAQKVTEATGRELKINGEFNLKLSLNPALAVNDVTFANASWGSRPDMVKIKRLEIELSLLPLISGNIVVNHLMLVEPDILLETNSEGRGNWILGKEEKPSAKPDSSGQDTIIPLVNEVRIKNASLTYRDGSTEKTIHLLLNNFKARSVDLQSPFFLDIDGTYNKISFVVGAELGPLNQLIKPTEPYPVNLEVKALETEIKLNGSVKTPAKGKGLDLTVSVKGVELTKLLELAELPQLKGKTIPQIGPFNIAAHVTDPGGKLSVTDINVAVGKKDLALLKVNGMVKNALEAKGIDLKLSVTGTELTKLVELAELPQLKGKTIPQIGPFNIAAHLTGSRDKISVNDINVAVGKKDLALVKASGAVKNVLEAKGIDLKLSVTGTELTKLVKIAELPQLKGKTIPQIGPFDIAAHVTGSRDKMSVKDIKVAVGKKDFALIKVNGMVKNALKGKGIDLKLSAEGSNLANVSKLAEVEVPLAVPFQLSADLTDHMGAYFLKRLNAKIGRSKLAGTVSVKTKGKRPLVNVSFTSLNLDLNELKPPPAEKEEKKPQKLVFSDDPLPLEILKAVDATVIISNGRILSNGLELKNIKLNMNLKDGKLLIRPLKSSIAGGTFQADVTVNARSAKTASVKAEIDIKKINIATLLRNMKITKILSDGKVNLKINVQGSGNSLHKIMAGLNGRISLVMNKGTIENKYVNFATGDFINLITLGGSKKKYTNINCFVSRFDIKKGLAENKVLLFDADNITVTGDGNIDLSTEKLNLSLNPKAKKVSLLSLAVPLNVRGTLAEPSVLPDAAGTVKKIAGGIFGGMAGMLGSANTKGAGDENPCLEALSQRKKTTTTKTKPPPAPQPKQEEQKPLTPGNILEGIGKGLGGLFK